MNDPSGADEFKSRSAEKREYQTIKTLAQELTQLSPSELAQLSIAPGLSRAIEDAGRMKKSALQRQLKYVTGMLANEDVEHIRRQLFVLRQPRRSEHDVFHQYEKIRDALMAGDSDLQERLQQQLDTPQRQQLRQLVRNAGKSTSDSDRAKSGRALFRFVRDHELK